jgi:hypothetical protein
MLSLQALRARMKNYIRPRLAALALSGDDILAMPFVSAKVIPERSGEFTIVPKYACGGQNTAVPPESLWEGYCIGSGSEAYLAEGRRTMTRMLDALRAAGADPTSMRRVGVDGVAASMGEVVAAHAVVFLEVTDHRLDGGAAFELTLDLRRAAPLLAGRVDLELVIGRGVVATIAGVADAAIEDVADERLHLRNDGGQRVPVIGIAGQRCDVSDELTASGMLHGGWRRSPSRRIRKAGAPCLCRCTPPQRAQGIDLAAALAALLFQHAPGKIQRPYERFPQIFPPADAPSMSRMTRPR